MTDLYVTAGAAGGGAGTEGDPYTMAEATANVTNADKVYVKAGTYTADDSASSSVMDIDIAGGGATGFIFWEAYTTTIGDFTIGDAQPVIIDANTNSLTNAMQSTVPYNGFIGFRFTGASSNGVNYGTADLGCFIGCKFDTNGARGFSGDNNFLFVGCESTANTSGGVNMDNTGFMISCKVHNEAANSVIMGGSCAVVNTTFYNNANAKNLNFDGTFGLVFGNTFDGENQAASEGFGQTGSSNVVAAILNNIFFDLNEGATIQTGTTGFWGYNLFASCNTDYDTLTNASTDISSAADPFEDSANRDYTLKSGSEAIDTGIDSGNL